MKLFNIISFVCLLNVIAMTDAMHLVVRSPKPMLPPTRLQSIIKIKPNLAPTKAQLPQRFAAKPQNSFNWYGARAVVIGLAGGFAVGQLYKQATKVEKIQSTEIETKEAKIEDIKEEVQYLAELWANKINNKHTIYRNYILDRPWKKTAQQELNKLDQEEKELTEKFLKLAGISYEEFLRQAKLVAFVVQLKSCNSMLEYPLAGAELTQEVKEIAKKMGLEPESIMVLADNSIRTGANQGHFLRFNENYYKKADKERFAHTVLHELAHHTCDTCKCVLINNYLIQEMQAKKFNYQRYTQLHDYFVKYRHFIEKRADIYAGLCDYDGSYAACVEFQEEGEQEGGDVASNSHPSNFDRSDYLEALHDAMVDEVIDNQTNI